jgi:hypothetical protein
MMEVLERELDRWEALGRTATLWLRDDDACADAPALRRLLGLGEAFAIPIAIAAIPARLETSLERVIGSCLRATIVQHGYAHRNHAAAGEKSAELASSRDQASTLAELARGRACLSAAFGRRFAPILVPPWNRVDDALLPHLGSLGFAGLSRFGPRRTTYAAPRLPQVNAHVDPVVWRRGRAFIGAAPAASCVAAHLAARREGTCDGGEPTGLLTHHLAFGDDAWDFVRALLHTTTRHRAARWLGVREIFAGSDAVTSARCA